MSDEKFREKFWYTLKEACLLKGINYRTALNRIEIRPNSGVPDGIIAGRKKWRKETIEKWVKLTDEDLIKGKGVKS